ncbi:MAG: hypothetical protein ACI4J1_05965 [Ruminiclostridium sp.]
MKIEMLPLSFAEFYELVGGDRRDAWNRYFTNGGLPYTAYIHDGEILHDYLLGIYNTVNCLKDNKKVYCRKIRNFPAVFFTIFSFGLESIKNYNT